MGCESAFGAPVGRVAVCQRFALGGRRAALAADRARPSALVNRTRSVRADCCSRRSGRQIPFEIVMLIAQFIATAFSSQLIHFGLHLRLIIMNMI